MSDEEWRKWLIEALGYEPKDLIAEVVVSDGDGPKEIETNQADGSSSIARRFGSDVELEMRGPPPRNEDDVEDVLRALAGHLSIDGVAWSSRVRTDEPETGADGWLAGPSDRAVDVQVTRALSDSDLMRRLSHETVEKQESAAVVADTVLAAAQRKAHPNRGPEGARRDLLLALDATRLPQALLPSVRDVLEARSREFTALGFRAVYLVGKSPERTFRLDDDVPENRES